MQVLDTINFNFYIKIVFLASSHLVDLMHKTVLPAKACSKVCSCLPMNHSGDLSTLI